MSGRLPVDLIFEGEPFHRQAVVHVCRHLAMRAGWTLTPGASYRLVYATVAGPAPVDTFQKDDIVIFSSPSVGEFFSSGRSLFPLVKEPELEPFPHPGHLETLRRGWIDADLIAGIHAVLHLFFEHRSRSDHPDGWIKFVDDWWVREGFSEPAPLVDLWLDRIVKTASECGWPECEETVVGMAEAPFTVVLTHDVDYLPSSSNRGLPRLIRAMARQLITRKRPFDAGKVLARYLAAVGGKTMPYDNVGSILAGESLRGATSSFQFTVANHHHCDPPYRLDDDCHRDKIRDIIAADAEICLHGSYTASRVSGRIANEKEALEEISGKEVKGYRQHYLNFHPNALFKEAEESGLEYDMSLGYNDMSGPRAGTYFPYRPFDLASGTPRNIWEIPFVLMDTTLALSFRYSRDKAEEHVKRWLEEVAHHNGTVSVIWHQEQLGGLLDPEYDGLYYDMLDFIRSRGGKMVSGETLIPYLDELWRKTIT